MYFNLEVLFYIIGQFHIVLSIEYFTLADDHINDLATCLVNIISRVHIGAELAIINNDEMTNDMIRGIHASSNAKLYIKDYNKPVNNTSPHVFIIHVEDFVALKVVIGELDRDWNRKPESLHIIILTETAKEDRLAIFRLLWEYHIIKALIITGDVDNKASIYTYFPYEEGWCGLGYNNIIKVCECEDSDVWDVFLIIDYLDKPALRNCTLRVATHNYPPLVLEDPNPDNIFAVGIERYLVEMFFAQENITLNYTFFPETDEFGNISDNFTVTGVLSKLYKNEVDVVFGGFALNHRRSAFFSYICSHLTVEDSFVAISPRADLLERWKIVYIIFNTFGWSIILLLYFICAMFLSFFNNSSGSRKHNYYCSVVFKLIGNTTNNTALVLTDNIYKNVLTIHWIWYMFLLCTFYQTQLTTYTTYRLYKSQVNEYMNLRNYNWSPCLATDIGPFLKNSGDIPIINEKYLEYQECETGDLALDQVAKTQTKYTVTNYLRYQWWITQHPHGIKKIHLMRNNFYNLLYGIFFKRGFPLLDTFESHIWRFAEYGFIEAIKSFHCLRKYSRTSAAINHSLEIRVLILEDLTIPFAILISGIILSCFIFTIEFSYTRRRNVNWVFSP
ncbi:uncharacterized protein LOC133517047 [Cydia pomonella]|uniref:uncharacterized protein LOC133517047 n=1 Tax=Cydia pomonella TaxID=82600 RepID=UPI002ADDE8E3|nr:uncharacterized protein LOC133517047 [Cydia pomonella]